MLQFSNEPLALTHIHLSYLSLEERIGFMMWPENDLLKEGRWRLTPQDIPKFRQTIQLSLENDYQKLIDNKVRIIHQPGDDAPLILARTIQEQEREKASLLKHPHVTEARKKELRDINPEDSIENVIKLDTLLNNINMELSEPKLPKKRYDDFLKYMGLLSLNLTRIPEALIVRLQEYFPNLNALYLSWNELGSLPESLGNLALRELYLNHNKFTIVPESIGNLKALKILNLLYNPLITLPKSLRNLTALKKLLLNNDNTLQTLPGSLRPILFQTKNTHLYSLLAPEQPLTEPKRKPMLLAPCPRSSERVKKSNVYTPLKKIEKRKSAPESEYSWSALQAMVKEVDDYQKILVVLGEGLSDAASIAALDAVRDFLNNPENINDFDGLRALLTDAPGEQMGMGMAVKQFKEVPVSKLYDNLFKALQDASPKGKIRKIM